MKTLRFLKYLLILLPSCSSVSEINREKMSDIYARTSIKKIPYEMKYCGSDSSYDYFLYRENKYKVPSGEKVIEPGSKFEFDHWTTTKKAVTLSKGEFTTDEKYLKEFDYVITPEKLDERRNKIIIAK